MNFKSRTNNITKILYVILILCIAGIMIVSVYSLFNQNKNTMNSLKNGNILNNITDNAANAANAGNTDNADNAGEAIKNFYRQQTTQGTTQPATTKKPAPTQSAATADAAVLPPPAINQDEQVISPAPAVPAATGKKADSAVEPTEKAVEVMSVPAAPVFIKPLAGYVSKVYNTDTPEYSVAMNDYRTHSGIDIDSDVGVNVRAVCDGVVAEVTDDPLMGKTVVINHSGNIQSIYMNLQEAIPKNITAGAQVKAGDVIGGVGETALIEMTDVPHLHLEMKKDGEYVNPLDYITF